MDFGIEPPAPLKVGADWLSFCELVDQEYPYAGTERDEVVGCVDINGESRRVQAYRSGDVVGDVSLLQVEEEDTFCRIVLNQSDRDFRKALDRAGIRYLRVDGGITLEADSVCFTTRLRRVTIITWE